MSIDETIGRNLARLRGDMTQQELATQMREHGFKWSQSTVWSVEKGDRPLRLSEAEAINRILGSLTSSYLVWPEPMIRVQQRVRQVDDIADSIKVAFGVLEDAQLELAFEIDELEPEAIGGLYRMVEQTLRTGIDQLRDEYFADVRAKEAAEVARNGQPAAGGSENNGPLVKLWNETWRPDGQRSEAS